jgi:hypothetical protein
MLRSLITLLLLLILGPLTYTPTINAQDSDSDGLITFEDGNDEELLTTQVGGLRFSTSTSANWRYGDIRTGRYNAPYPANCPVYGGPCAYAVSDDFFVWLGGTAGIGRVDVISGTMSLFSAGFSTGEILTIEAYNANDELVAEAEIAPNLRTGQLTVGVLQAPAMSYILFRGNGNRWLMDDLRIALVGDPRRKDPDPLPVYHPAQLTITQRALANGIVRQGSMLDIAMAVTNRGKGMATNATISMPFDSERFILRDASFSQTGLWVSKITSDTIQIQTGPIGGGGDIVTATLHLMVRDNAVAGGSISEQLRLTWRDRAGGGISLSNRLEVSVGTLAPGSVVQMSVQQNSGEILFSNSLFAPNEPIALWYHLPTGEAVALGRIVAGVDGDLNYRFSTDGLEPGRYIFVAYGLWTELHAQGVFVTP